MADFDAGSIEGRLELDRDPFTAGLRVAQQQARDFEADTITAHVDLDAAEAEARLAALRAQKGDIQERVDLDDAMAEAKLDRLKAKAKDAHTGGFKPLLDSIILLGPAIVPMGAAGVAALGGLIGSAGVAVLAFMGIKKEIEANTALGKIYSGQLGILKGDLGGLEHIAAAGVLRGFERGVSSLHGLMPLLSSDTRTLSGQLGLIVGNTVPALVTLLHRLNPLFVDLGAQLVRGSAHFLDWSRTSDGVSKFVIYAEKELPVVEHFIGDLATALGHVAVAAGPLGGVALRAIDDFSIAIANIPIPILTVLLATLQVGRLLAIANGLKTMAAAQMASNAAWLGSLGPIGLVVAGSFALKAVMDSLGVSFESTVHGIQQTSDAAFSFHAVWHTLFGGGGPSEDVNSVTEALKKSKGAFDNNVKDAIAAQLAYDGLGDKAAKAHISLATLTTGIIGNDAAFADLVNAWKGAGASDFTIQRLVKLRKEFQNGSISAKDLAKAEGELNTQTEKLDPKAAAAAAKLGMTVEQYKKAKDTADKNTQATKDATLAFILENNALGLLNQAFDTFAGKNLATAQSETALDSALLSATATLKTNHAAMSEHTEAGVADRGAIEQVAQATRAHAQAVADQTHNTVLASQAMATGKQRMEESLRAQGLLTPAVQAYINTIFKIPTNWVTKTDIAKAKAEQDIRDLQAHIDAIKQGKVPGLNANSAAGKLIIWQMQQAINNIKQGRPPGITTDTAAGRFLVRDLQAKINAINQGKVPGLTANNAAGLLAKRQLQDAINALSGTTVKVDVNWVGHESWAARASGLYAKGGLLKGPGGPKGDKIPILGSDQEYMVQAAAVNKYGVELFENLNAMKLAAGGRIIMEEPSPAMVRSGYSHELALIENLVKSHSPTSRPTMPIPTASMGSGSVGAFQRYAASLFPFFGWGGSQLGPLINLWNGESGWNPAAYNPNGGATGIPQALPGSKMASEGADWWWNGNTQIRWGEKYIAGVYGSPANAWSQWQGRNPHWYGTGMPPTEFARPTLIGVGDRGPETVSVTPGRRHQPGDISLTEHIARIETALKELARQLHRDGIQRARQGIA